MKFREHALGGNVMNMKIYVSREEENIHEKKRARVASRSCVKLVNFNPRRGRTGSDVRKKKKNVCTLIVVFARRKAVKLDFAGDPARPYLALYMAAH